MTEPKLAVDLAGLQLHNPLIVGSGTFAYGEEFMNVAGFKNEDIGAIALKGTTLEPREGNATPRVAETASGMLNSIGLQNPGADAVVRDILPRLRAFDTKLIANIAGGTVEEYREVARRFAEAPGADAIEVNISCPNVHRGGAAFGSDPAMAAQVVAAVREVWAGPLIAKLTPNVTDIVPIAAACIDAGADILSLINTLRGMVIDTATRRPVLGNNFGGLSGPAVKPVAILMVHQVYQVASERNVPVIGMGGISTANDAIEFIIAGASAFSVGTALFWNASVCRQIIDGLRAYLVEHEIDDVAKLVGTLKTN